MIKEFIKEKLKKLPKEEPSSAYDNAIISWSAPEYERHNRGMVWKICVIGLLALAVVLGIFNRAWTFSLALLALSFAYYSTHRHDDKLITIKLSAIGIKIGNLGFPYSRIRSFGIVYKPPFVKKLILRIQGDYVGEHSLFLEDVDPAMLRAFLLEKQIAEVKNQTESITEIYSKIFKI